VSDVAAPLLISVDWGTTSLRCMLVDGDGAVLAHVKSDRGILKTGGQAFGDVLFGEIAPWLDRFPEGSRVPVLLSGMIGSRQGWQEATYLRCPASPHDLARNLMVIDTVDSPLSGCDVRIVPGMDIADPTNDSVLPDVMRGEETQVFGALLGAGLSDGVFVLPGTHSKWVLVEKGTIVKFHTFMTGELYAALLEATILGRLAEDGVESEEGFALGVDTATRTNDWAGPGQFLNMVFTARSRVLHGELEPSAVRGYLSGLLIGAEILSGLKAGIDAGGNCGQRSAYVIGENVLRDRYEKAAAQLRVETRSVGENPVPIAHLAIARLAGLVA
jgi:2-dehydro-3-deoxygalactonokinase